MARSSPLDETPYNPLDIDNLGESVADAILERPVQHLHSLNAFRGAGIYAIYYLGDFPAYQPLAARNRDGQFTAPIYVGEAVHRGASTGRGRENRTVGIPLFDRLGQHRTSIMQATNLDVTDFYCRYLVTHDVWIPLGETVLIERFQPLWNIYVRGFGNKNPGGRRQTGERPMWDTIHPGRPWATNMPPNRQSETQILERIRQALGGAPVAPLPEDEVAAEAESDRPEN
ncbi:MAG: Eco29kI family restriction endonuclease [Thermomicrobiales bacterium]